MSRGFGRVGRRACAWLGRVVLAGLTGCGGGGNSAALPQTPQSALAQLEAQGRLPILDRGPTLRGTDANANGVRDDIERYIEGRYAEPAQRRAAMQTAVALQRALLVDTSDAKQVADASEAGMRAAKCRALAYPDVSGFPQLQSMSRDLEALTTNTRERLLAYLAYNQAVHGTISSVPEGDICE